MKTAFKIFAITLSAAVLSPSASAAETSLHDRLTVEQGMSEMSPGFYAQKSQTGESFVATSAAGQRALAQKLREVRALQQNRLSKKQPSHAEQAALNKTENLLKQLETSVSKDSQSGYENCSNGALLYVSAASSSGSTATGYAVVALDFGPVTPTLNYADAYNDNGGDTNYGSGYAAAQASVDGGHSCFAAGFASVTCPDESSPKIVAYAYSQSNRPRCYL